MPTDASLTGSNQVVISKNRANRPSLKRRHKISSRARGTKLIRSKVTTKRSLARAAVHNRAASNRSLRRRQHRLANSSVKRRKNPPPLQTNNQGLNASLNLPLRSWLLQSAKMMLSRLVRVTKDVTTERRASQPQLSLSPTAMERAASSNRVSNKVAMLEVGPRGSGPPRRIRSQITPRTVLNKLPRCRSRTMKA